MTKRYSSLALAALLVGCTVGPDYHRPESRVSSQWLEPAAEGQVDAEWWRSFDDPQLSALVERALGSSPDLREAEARLTEARANRDAARGGRLPQATVAGSATRNVLSENGQLLVANIPGFDRSFPLYDIGFDASWELDFWGKQRRSVEAADSRVDAAMWGRRDARVMLIAELARAYVDLRGAQADLAIAEDGLAAQTELASLLHLRFRAGEANRIEADRQESQRAGAQAARDVLAAQVAAATYRIAVLVGERPEDIVADLRQPGAIPEPPATIVSGVRSELLERRPDVRRAERELAAATASIGVAKADLFPRFSLTGTIGQQARDPGDITSGGSTRLTIGPTFSWPIFSAGRIRAQVRAADARAEAAAARYEKAVVGALADSESAANRFGNASSAAQAARVALERETNAYDLVKLRVSRGEDDRLALMQARLKHAEALRQERDAAAARASAAIALYKSLGGGWSGEPES
ncbi:MAG: efflux transporter outer membrane subunit [Sphingobium sp.]